MLIRSRGWSSTQHWRNGDSACGESLPAASGRVSTVSAMIVPVPIRAVSQVRRGNSSASPHPPSSLRATAHSPPLGQTPGTLAPSAHRTCLYSSHSSKRDGVALEHPLFYTFHVTSKLAQEICLYLLHTWVSIHLFEFLLLPIIVKHLHGFMEKRGCE
jgi:hypothetical protein